MKQAKLTKTQSEVLEYAKKDIGTARALPYREWFIETIGKGMRQDWIEKAIQERQYDEYYENAKNGIVLTHCNGRTLKKLENLGYIEIIEDSTGERYGIDVVKVLNY